MGISLDVFGNVSFGATLSLGAVNQLANQLCAPPAPPVIEDGPTGQPPPKKARAERPSTGAALAAGHAEQTRWVCGACTYINEDPSWLACDMCRAARDTALAVTAPFGSNTRGGSTATASNAASAGGDLTTYKLHPTEYVDDYEGRFGDESETEDEARSMSRVSLDQLNVQITYHVAKSVHRKQKVTFGCGMKDDGSPLNLLSGILVDRIFAFLKPPLPLPLPAVLKEADSLAYRDYRSGTNVYTEVMKKLAAEIEALGGSPVAVRRDSDDFRKLQKQLRVLHYSKHHTVELQLAVDGGEYRKKGAASGGEYAWFILTTVNATPSGFGNDFRGFTYGDSVGFVSPLSALTVAPGATEVIETHLTNLFPNEYTDANHVKKGFSHDESGAAGDGRAEYASMAAVAVSAVGWHVAQHASYG
jgi:hypothetical protein